MENLGQVTCYTQTVVVHRNDMGRTATPAQQAETPPGALTFEGDNLTFEGDVLTCQF